MGQKEIKITWTKAARADLRKIHSFVAEKSESAAFKQVAKILEKTKILKAGYLEANQREELLKIKSSEYRYLVQDHYKIIYRIMPNEAVIAAVFDTRQNPDKLPKKV